MLESVRSLYRDRVREEKRARVRDFLRHNFRWARHAYSRALFGRDLAALAAFNGTDKGTSHNYLHVYGALFGPIRGERLNILEIGVGGYDDPRGGGGSLRMWRTFFPKGHVFAIDVVDKSPHDEDRITTFRGSQDDEAFLNRVVDRIGRLDVVIDDGSHVPRHVIKSFEVLFPRLEPGGIYVVEDTHASYKDDYEGSTDLARPDSTINYFRRMVDGPNSEEIRLVKPDHSPPPLEEALASIAFHEKQIVMTKKVR